MIVVTGGAGFIGSALVWGLNAQGQRDILIVDRLGEGEKWKNLVNLRYRDFVHADSFFEKLRQRPLSQTKIDAIIHMGACSRTTERGADYLMKNNYAYTLALAEYCLERKIRFIYASSAATYGAGEYGYSDESANSERLRPLNMYGYSKQVFDLRAIAEGWEKRIVGLKFFNVFGPNEYHKGEMRSVAHKAWGALSRGENFRLFRSHRPDFADGEQKRDFVWVKDIVNVILFFLERRELAGIYNVGSGKATSFNELLRAVSAALRQEPRPEYIDMPGPLREGYQYFTEADTAKLRSAGYTAPFTPLGAAVREYVQEYLEKYPWLSP